MKEKKILGNMLRKYIEEKVLYVISQTNTMTEKRQEILWEKKKIEKEKVQLANIYFKPKIYVMTVDNIFKCHSWRNRKNRKEYECKQGQMKKKK